MDRNDRGTYKTSVYSIYYIVQSKKADTDVTKKNINVHIQLQKTAR